MLRSIRSSLIFGIAAAAAAGLGTARAVGPGENGPNANANANALEAVENAQRQAAFGQGNGNGPDSPPGLNGLGNPSVNSAHLGWDIKIGALHAAKADLNAFLHANPNSEINKIAVYAQAVVVLEGAQVAFDASLMVFATAYPAYPDYEIATLQARYEFLMGLATPTPPEQAEMVALEAVLASYAAVLAAQEQADTSLLAAANMPVDDTVKTWVNEQLEAGGILDYYRSLL